MQASPKLKPNPGKRDNVARPKPAAQPSISGEPAEYQRHWTAIQTAGLILLALVALGGFALRFYKLDSDPPFWGYVFNTDEGHYSYNAHNRLVHGHWFVNEAKYGLVTPLFALAQYLVALLGSGEPTVAHFRLISAVSGVISCCLMASGFKDNWRRMAGVALTSTSFMLLTHSRLGITEMMLTMMLQVTVIAAWQACSKAKMVWAIVAGASALCAITVKPTAAFIVPVALVTPLLCRSLQSSRRRYWTGLAIGAGTLGAIWAAIVVLPNWDAWRYLMQEATSFGRNSISTNFSAVKNLGTFLLSPALQTTPFLWPFALCWCLLCWIPRWHKKQNTAFDTLIFLWIVSVVGIQGISDYQPARWQVMLFPPVIWAGLNFLAEMKRPVMAVAGLLTAVVMSACYSFFIARAFHSGLAPIEPANGIFGHYAPASMVAACFVVSGVTSKVCRFNYWKGLACSVLVIELAIQCWFCVAYTKPALTQPNQWNTLARSLEELESRGEALFSGDIVQDLSLRAKIHVLPTYYFLKQPTDESVRSFFIRHKAKPTYFVLLDSSLEQWATNAPRFSSALEEVSSHFVIIGGLGRQRMHVFRFASYDWMNAQ